MVVSLIDGSILTAKIWNGIQWFSGIDTIKMAGPFANAWTDVSGGRVPAVILNGTGTIFADFNFEAAYAATQALFRLLYTSGTTGSPGTVFKTIDPCYGSNKSEGDYLDIKGFVSNIPSGTYSVWLQVNQTAGSPNAVNIGTQNSGTAMILTTLDAV